ncbi:hypothetical protein PYCCODRAFT_1436557 [Trametes coccinea BRFM310]|uniref:F-box domain-containing protein n=1 Tax=Trametes coccinea (strain BRFM310) TaxID=1353009 RepID=A0A1Y2IL23_TRAC3|nr:hypothetical protein PYCCODRAFT_1436557 [Trametes coccinea BRFM310]
MAGFRFLELPDELQLRILSKLDARSILACRQVDPGLAQAIDEAVEMQYRLELQFAGMIDGPPGTISVRDRLDALRAYRAAWNASRHPVHTLLVDSDILGPHLRGISHFEQTTGRLRLHRPAGTFCGLTEYDAVFDELSERIAADWPYDRFAINYSEDFIAYISNSDSDPSGVYVHFASLSQNYQPHPLANRPIIQTCSPLEDVGCWSVLGCSGDLVSWHLCRWGALPSEMMVVNWKTGTIVWHMHSTSDQQFLTLQILTSTHLVVIDDSDKFSLRIYAFDPSASDNAPLATDSDCIYALALPTRSHRVDDHWLRVAFEPQPQFANDHPLFSHDPNLSLLALTIMLGLSDTDFPSGLAHDGDCFLLLIPLETLLRFDTADTELLRGRIIPWEDWGPKGTKMLQIWEHVTQDVSVFGSRVALPNWREIVEGKLQCLVTVYEVHKLANEVMPTSSDAADATRGQRADHERDARAAASKLVVTDDDWITDSLAWKDPIHTTYPFRKTFRTITPSDVPYGEYQQTAVHPTADGLLYLIQKRRTT